MKRLISWGVGVSLIALAPGAQADTLREALLKAYRDNPSIARERSSLRAIDENVPLAKANGRPDVSLTGDYVEYLKQAENSFVAPERQLSSNAQVTVPLFNGGQVRNSVRAAETRSLAGRANLRSAEANLFTNVVAAYNDVIRDEAIVQLNQQNVRVLDVNLQATRDRFEVGDLTRTDVAQSEARLAVAVGQLRGAEAQLVTSRETYVQLVGDTPDTLEAPPALPNLPAETTTAVATALNNNPALAAAERERDATRFDTRAAKGARLPQVSAFVGGNYFNYLNTLGSATVGGSIPQTGTAAQGGLSLTVPLYQGGRPAAQVRQAQARESVAIETVTETERGVIAQARSAFANWQSSLRVIESAQVAVDANQLSLEGVRAENTVGTRTILDILNAEQELLNSQVTLVTARRDAYVAGFALLAAMGKAEAQDLGLDGGALYDPIANYDRVEGKWFDWDDDETPVAVGTRTVDVPAQTPVVAKPLEPELQRDVDTDPANPSVDE
ncbi:TolC family outer membrane protein [Sphingomonas japonica]|uniref:Outer membrane protein n=1 Tax=Sphingomonas japonica TaxID=511662 RepID=A0ABX0U2K0_9SPHN|nr:TolC family outer membrane protein [Sphingomonas japonica]NIJ24718.1 outer membrane protein [Sphingomonas japonica]